MTHSSPAEAVTAEATLEFAKTAVDAALDRQANDIVLLDLRQVADFADFFVICTAQSARQIKAVADAIDESVTRSGLPLRRREGDADSGWTLLDFGDIVVHVFGPEERDYYRLERLWKDATQILQIQ